MSNHGKRLGPGGTLIDAALGNVQLMQLAWWQDQADKWGIYFSVENAAAFVRCKKCDRAIMSVGGYLFQLQELTAQTVAHLRQFHREIGADGREDAKVGDSDDMDRHWGGNPDPGH